MNKKQEGLVHRLEKKRSEVPGETDHQSKLIAVASRVEL